VEARRRVAKEIPRAWGCGRPAQGARLDLRSNGFVDRQSRLTALLPRALFFQLDVQTVRFSFANVFHGMCLGIVPDDLAGLGRDGVCFSVGQGELRRPTR
jgi:hypothetical protein